MNQKKCANCGSSRCAGCTGHNCDCCHKKNNGLAGVTPIVRPGDPIPDRKAAPVSPCTGTTFARATEAANAGAAASRGKIPELTIKANRYTDRERGRNTGVLDAKIPAGPVTHRYSDAAAPKAAPAPHRYSEPAAPAPQPAAAVVAAPVTPVVAPRAPGMPVKDAPKADVQAEAVRRLKSKL